MEEKVWFRHEDDTDKAEDCGCGVEVAPLFVEHTNCKEACKNRSNEGEGSSISNGNLYMIVTRERDLCKGKEVASDLNASEKTS